MRALFISAGNVEDVELLYPMYRLQEEAIETDVAAMQRGVFRGNRGYEFEANLAVDEVDPAGYDLLVLPGGKAPAELRQQQVVRNISRHFFEWSKPVAAICHGPQILISAGVMAGRHATAYPGVADELRQAGADYTDQPVVVDGNLVTSRLPQDLPYFMREAMGLLRQRR